MVRAVRHRLPVIISVVNLCMTKFFSATCFMLGLMDFSDIAILCSRPNSCCQQNL